MCLQLNLGVRHPTDSLPASNATPAIWSYLERFHAGEVPLNDFEQWVYNCPELESVLGRDEHLALLTLNYHARDARNEVRQRIEDVYAAHRPGRLLRDRVRRLAVGILDGDIDVITGCRELTRAYHDGGEEWIPIGIVGIDSELDTVPTPDEYHRWDSDALKVKLNEARDEIEFYRPQVLAIARELLERV